MNVQCTHSAHDVKKNFVDFCLRLFDGMFHGLSLTMSFVFCFNNKCFILKDSFHFKRKQCSDVEVYVSWWGGGGFRCMLKKMSYFDRLPRNY